MGHVNHLSSEGLPIPSVSEVPNISKEFFFEDMSGYQDWICRQSHSQDERCCTKAQRDYYEECANLGNDIHTLREAFLRGETFEEGVPEYQAAVFEPVARFYKDNGYKPHVTATGEAAIELQMTGKEFGGTLDGAGTFSVPFWEKQRKTFWANKPADKMPLTSSIWIEDLKIKSKLDKLHPLQLYGYRLLMIEKYGICADWGLIIRREKNLGEKPEIQLKAYWLPGYEEEWKASMKMWRFLNA